MQKRLWPGDKTFDFLISIFFILRASTENQKKKKTKVGKKYLSFVLKKGFDRRRVNAKG